MRFGTTVSFVFALAPFAAVADMGCDTGTRPLTDAEKAFYAKIDRVVKALPPAPEGWIREDVDVPSPSKETCKDLDAGLRSGAQQMTFAVYASYRREAGVVEDQASIEAAIPKRDQRLTPAETKRLETLGKEMEEINKQVADAANKQDFDRLRALQADIGRNMDEQQRLFDKRDGEVAALVEEAGHDSGARIAVRVNEMHYVASCPKKEAKVVQQPGAAFAFTMSCESPPKRILLYGPWKKAPDEDDFHRKTWKRTAAQTHAAGYSIVVEIGAEEATASKLLEKTDLKALQSLLSR